MSDTTVTARSAARTFGVSVLAGGLSGLVVGGLGGRLFMFVLARLNPEESGVKTDDGFTIDQFTLGGTLNLLVVGTVIGVFGGLVFLGLRGLRFGPPWFRTLSMPLGATVVVGSMLVRSEGVDFQLLQPWWLAVGMTLAVPFVYTLMLVALGDRWIGDRPSVWSRLPRAVPWVARAALAVLAVMALSSLMSTIDEIANPFQLG